MLCRDSQLSQVLERGSGNAVALAILYMEVCARMGLAMAARLLDGGRYVVLWPTDAPLRTCGQQFVVDAYSQGELFLLDEVRPVMMSAGMGTTDATDLVIRSGWCDMGHWATASNA